VNPEILHRFAQAIPYRKSRKEDFLFSLLGALMNDLSHWLRMATRAQKQKA
jgi:hypothetical protein